MNLQMFQFIFISVSFHYGVEINGSKATRKNRKTIQAVLQHTQTQLGYVFRVLFNSL